MELLRNFTKLDKTSTSLAGGKGASLGEMTQAGIPVPPGFVILASAFEQFLQETDLGVEIDSLLHTVHHQEMHTVEHASETIQKLILDAQMPLDIERAIQKEFKKLNSQYVAVRSSATAEDSASAAWAGQLESYLNTTKDTVLANVQKCWASLFTPRAIFYRFEKGLHNQKISVAVVIQTMVESEKSGIAFSVHPVTEDRNQLIIEAGYGLGESIVSGQITPDSYVVEKTPRRIVDKNVVTQERGLYRKKDGGNAWQNIPQKQGASQKLSDLEILKLSEMILKIEKHYGTPQDIEWAWEACPNAKGGRDGEFYIVQSRPITTLSSKSEKPSPSLIKIEKTISRDLPFANIYAWHKGYTDGMKAWLGWSYSDSLFYVHDGFVDIMRPPKEHLGDFKKIVVKKIDDDQKWFFREYKMFLTHTEKIYAFYDKHESYLEKCSDKELLTFYKQYVRHITEIMGPFITMLWFPIWCENNKDLSSKYLNEIKIGIAARKISEQIFPRGDALIMRLLKIINKDLGFEEPLLKVVSYEELVDYLQKRKILNRNTIVDRTKNFIYSRSGITFTGNESEKIINAFASLGYEYDIPDYSALGEIKGNTAYSGKVKGVVCVVMQKNLIGRFSEGEILVASMTTPEYVPAMKKAIAFVTDEGGITSHAAIIAREMKKPCIIGTKFATQVLHDGDLVEVDADKGVVRIIERKK